MSRAKSADGATPDNQTPSTVSLTASWVAASGGSSKGPGVAEFEITGPTRVTLRRLGDCGVVTRFIVEPGSRWAIQFGDEGFDRVDQEGGLDGAGFGSPDTLDCQEPPDTAAVSVIEPHSADPTMPLLLVAAGAGFIMALKRIAVRIRR